jgi:hypothetical protein
MMMNVFLSAVLARAGQTAGGLFFVLAARVSAGDAGRGDRQQKVTKLSEFCVYISEAQTKSARPSLIFPARHVIVAFACCSLVVLMACALCSIPGLMLIVIFNFLTLSHKYEVCVKSHFSRLIKFCQKKSPSQ